MSQNSSKTETKPVEIVSQDLTFDLDLTNMMLLGKSSRKGSYLSIHLPKKFLSTCCLPVGIVKECAVLEDSLHW